MTATTDFVGVRVFSDLSDQVVSIDTRDSTVIGIVGPLPGIDPSNETAIPYDEPFRISTDDPATVAMLGPGLIQDAVNQTLQEGIVTDMVFSRSRIPSSGTLDAQLAAIAGDPSAKTGVWTLLHGIDDLKLEPGSIIVPGYTSQRLGGLKNPVAAAMDSVCSVIIDCMGIVQTPATSREDAAAYAQDFEHSLNMIAMYPQATFELGGEVVRDITPSVAAAMVRSDKANGNPYKAFWNKPLLGVLGPSQRVSYRDGDTTSDANYLNQNGVGTVIEGNLLWSPFNTATDPTIVGYRSIKRIRTRRAIEKALLRPLRAYLAEDLGPHLVTRIGQSIDQACAERKAVGALIGWQILWPRSLNPNDLLRKGGLRLQLRFEETPDLTDLGIYSNPLSRGLRPPGRGHRGRHRQPRLHHLPLCRLTARAGSFRSAATRAFEAV